MRPLLVLPLLLLSCTSGAPRGLMLGVATDLVVPADVTSVGLYLQHLEEGGRVREQWSFVAKTLFEPAVGAYVVRFPATLGVESRGVRSDRLRVRAVAFYEDTQGVPAPKVMREARTSVPTDRVALLRLPLNWLNYGTVGDTAPGTPIEGSFDAMRRFTSGCPEEQTRNESGVCVSIDVDMGSLPPFVEDTEANPCFDAASVFTAGPGVSRGAVDACTIHSPGATSATTNVAIVAGEGYPVAEDLVRPLAVGDFTVVDGVIRLGEAACARVAADTTVLISTRTSAREHVLPICADWQTAATPSTPPVEAGAPETPESGAPDAALDASDAETPDAETPDADASDAEAPTTWDLQAEPLAIAPGASGLFVSTADTLRRYPRTPGPFEALSSARVYQRLVNLALPGESDALFGISSDQLYRIDPDTLAGTLIDPCSTGGCEAEIVSTNVLSSLALGIVRTGSLVFFATSEQRENPPYFRVYRMALDGTELARVSNDSFTAADGNFTSLFPWNDRAILGRMSFTGGGLTVYQNCTYSGCTPTSLGLTRDPSGALDRLAFYGASQAEGDSLFAHAGWEDTTPGSAGGLGLVHITQNKLKLLPMTVSTKPIVRRGPIACVNVPNAAIGCIHAQGTTPKNIQDAATEHDLTADDTWIYWVKQGTQYLHRTSWDSATPPGP